MDIQRYRVVAVGAKTPDILSKITKALTHQNYEIETISSLRLGHSIVVVCLLEASQAGELSIENCLQNIVVENQLQLTIDPCNREKYEFVKSDVFMRIRGNHIAGIKAYIISELIETGLDIHGLESDTYDKNGEKFFVINIKGKTSEGIESLAVTVDKLQKQKIDVTLANDWNLLV